MNRLFILLSLLIGCLFDTNGQAADPLKQALAALQAGDCTTAERLAREQISEQESGQSARAMLALVLATPTCVQNNPTEARMLLIAVNEWYTALDTKDKTRARERGYQQKYFRDAKAILLETARAEALATADTLLLDAFAEAYAPLLVRKEKIELAQDRNRLVVQLLRTQGTPAQWQAFMAARKQDIVRNHPALLDTIYRYQVEALLASGTWEQLPQGRSLFPDNPYLDANALAPFLKARETGNYAALSSAPSSNPWRSVAKDSMAAVEQRRAVLVEQLQGALAVIQDNSAAPEAWKAADPTIATGLAAGYLSLPGLEGLLQNIPNTRIPRTLDAILETYAQGNKLSDLYAFQEKYPDYPNAARLQILIRKRKAQVQRGQEFHTDVLLERLSDERQPVFWPSADQALAGRIPQMRPTTRDSVIAVLQGLPFERIRHSLKEIYSRHSSEDFSAWFPRISAKQLAQLTKEYASNCQTTFAALQSKIRPQLVEQNWKAALATAKTPIYANVLSAHPPYVELLDILGRDEVSEKMQPFGGVLNTEQNEFIPVLSPDEREIYFCREASETAPELLCKAVLEGNEWKDLGEVAAFSRGSRNTAPLSMTVDGNRLLIFRDGQLTYSDRDPSGEWGPTRAFSDNINAAGWQGMGTISPDGKVLIFETRQRSTSVGGTDLFLSFQDETGNWQPAIALSRIINTVGEDRSPYLHPDTRTLYFSSNGRGGFGDMDVYKTTRLDDSWLHWSTPVHLGRFANTTGIDWCYKITTNGDFAYFSADPDGDGMADIFKINLPEAARPEAVTIVETNLVTSDGEAIKGEVVIEDTATGEIMAIVTPNGKTGEVKVALPGNRDYILYTMPNEEDNLPLEMQLTLSDDATQALPETIVLETIEEAVKNGSVYRLSNFFFDYNDASLLPESDAQLNRVMAFLGKSDQFRMEIIGHTDSDGDEAYNQELSLRRANAVRQALIDRNVPPDRLITIGKGETQPIADNNSPGGKNRNRRVEVKFVQ